MNKYKEILNKINDIDVNYKREEEQECYNRIEEIDKEIKRLRDKKYEIDKDADTIKAERKNEISYLYKDFCDAFKEQHNIILDTLYEVNSVPCFLSKIECNYSYDYNQKKKVFNSYIYFYKMNYRGGKDNSNYFHHCTTKEFLEELESGSIRKVSKKEIPSMKPLPKKAKVRGIRSAKVIERDASVSLRNAEFVRECIEDDF